MIHFVLYTECMFLSLCDLLLSCLPTVATLSWAFSSSSACSNVDSYLIGCTITSIVITVLEVDNFPSASGRQADRQFDPVSIVI